MPGTKRPATTTEASEKSASSKTNKKEPQKGGLDEIDALFSKKKQQQRQQDAEAPTDNKKKKKHKSTSHNNSKLSYTREDLVDVSSGSWKEDGLGGKFNAEGYTGRRVEGQKVYKAHLFNKKNFGNTKDCPFDCDCCYI